MQERKQMGKQKSCKKHYQCFQWDFKTDKHNGG